MNQYQPGTFAARYRSQLAAQTRRQNALTPAPSALYYLQLRAVDLRGRSTCTVLAIYEPPKAHPHTAAATDARPRVKPISTKSIQLTDRLYDYIMRQRSERAYQKLILMLRSPDHAAAVAITLTNIIFSADRKLLEHDDLYALIQTVDQADKELRFAANSNAQADLHYLDMIVRERLGTEMKMLYSEQWDREGRQWVADLCRQYDVAFEPEVR